MADIRIKDLATTASTTASDDFLAVDGTTNGTRKLSAATPSFATSVTVPSVAGPTATDLTLTGGSTGASLVLGQGASGRPTLTAKGSELVWIDASASAVSPGLYFRQSALNASAIIQYPNYGSGGLVFQTSAPVETMRLTSTSNLLIGGTTDITGSGGLKVFGTTAASSTASGALQVAGGVGVAGAGYFGGNLNVTLGATGSSNFSATSYQDLVVTGRSGGAGPGGASVQFTTTGQKLYILGQRTDTAFAAADAFFLYDFTASALRLQVSTAGVVSIPLSTASTGAGTGALQVAGGIYAGANSVFAGDRLLAQKDQNAVTRLQVRNDTSGTAAQSQVSATLGDFTTYTAMGSLSAGFTTSGLFAANAGYIASNATAGLNLFTVGATSLTLGTNSTAALTLASGGAATFAGAVTATGSASTTAALRFDNQIGGGGTAQYYANCTVGATTIARMLRGNGLAGYSTNGLNIDNFGGFQIGLNVLGGSGESFKIRNAGTTDLLTIDSTGAATFAGSVITPAATTAISSVRLPHGTAPTSPVNGDMWTTTAGLYVRINGVTVGPLS